LAKRPKPKTTRSQRSRAVSPALKALFHHAAGAGKSRVKRKFFGLSDSEVDALAKFVSERIGANVTLKVEQR
jgi:hypothetical protein